MTKYIVGIFIIVGFYGLSAQSDPYDPYVSQEYILEKVNRLRAKGCKCGGKRMKSAEPVVWNKTLERSAAMHAREMYRYDYFSHKSIDGLDIGDRLDALGYKWHHVGENLAIGQKSFDEAMRDWIKSPSHCKMLMHPKMKEMALSRYKKYWVQHFGTQMPAKTRRTKITYTEG